MEQCLPTNVTGKQVSRLRNQLDLSQEQLSAKCQRVGLDISRGTLAKIEAGVRCVSDQEALLLSQALGVSVSDLFPKGKKK
ncbi:MAG: XRE family transcriptional regulator [Bacteroidia bacterium]|nr:XRE family transcriptional regulator [Bacteroidia bacterium]